MNVRYSYERRMNDVERHEFYTRVNSKMLKKSFKYNLFVAEFHSKVPRSFKSRIFFSGSVIFPFLQTCCLYIFIDAICMNQIFEYFTNKSSSTSTPRSPQSFPISDDDRISLIRCCRVSLQNVGNGQVGNVAKYYRMMRNMDVIVMFHHWTLVSHKTCSLADK